jgi:hypothetical protein
MDVLPALVLKRQQSQQRLLCLLNGNNLSNEQC